MSIELHYGDDLSCGGAAFRRLIGDRQDRVTAVLFRQVATPSYEVRSFLKTALRSGFDPVILTYENDRMSCHNLFKRSLVLPRFVEGFNRHGQPIWRCYTIVPVDQVDNRRLSEIVIGEQSLADLHGAVFRMAVAGTKVRKVDGGEWFSRYPRGARDYYVDIFKGLGGNAILFEDFVTDESERAFFLDVVQPAFEIAATEIGDTPKVAPIIANRRASSPLWYAYPDCYREFFATAGVVL